MKRNRLMALLLAGCMVFGNSPVLLQAAEQEGLLPSEQEDVFLPAEEEDLFLTDEGPEDMDMQEDASADSEFDDGDIWIEEEAVDEEIEDTYDAFREDLIVDEEEGIPENQIFYAEDADMTPPEIDLSTLKAEITDGKETATPGDTVKISVKATDDRGLAFVKFNQFKPNGDITGEISMNYNDETGMYECTRKITDTTYPGEYSAYYVRAIDTNSNTTWLYYNQHDLSGASYTVENANADTTPPEIDLSTLKAEITDGKETATPGDTVKISVKATDDQGLAFVKFNQFKPNGDTTGEISMNYNDETGMYECTREITDTTFPGEYSAYYVRAIDTNSNTTWLYYNQHDLSGASYTVENANADTTPPEIDLSTLKAEIADGKETATAGDTVKISVKATDDRGLAFVKFNQFKPNGDTTGEISMNYNDETGMYECTREITDTTYPGEYSAYYVRAIDTNSNTTWLYYNQHDLSGASYIVSGTTSDVTAPVIDTATVAVNISGDKGFAVSGDVVDFSLAASDEGLGISRINVDYAKPISGDKLRFRLTYNAETDKWEKTIPVDKTMEGGLWKIYSIEALDKGGNLTRIINTAFDTVSVDDLSAGDFTVRSTVRFDTRGGSQIPLQYVLPGDKAARPENPTKGNGAWQGGGDFVGWYADEALTQTFNFNNPITEDTTVYAKWAYAFSVCSYDKTNSADYDGGKYMVLRHGEIESNLLFGGCNFTVYDGETITLKAYPDKGYKLAGWYKGKYFGMADEEHTQVSRPLDMSDPDNLLTTDPEYTFVIDRYTVICSVFEQLPRYDVTFDSNGGSGEMETLRTYTGYPCPACTFTAPGDKHFAGWNTSADGLGKAYKENDALELTEAVTLYAQWENHFWTEKAAMSATCTAEGSRIYTCTCGAEKTDSIPVDPDTHQFTKAIKKATPYADGLVYEKCSRCGKEQPVTVLPKANGCKLSASAFTYDGKAKKPAVTVTDSAGAVLAASNYTVTYANNINAGTATATVAFKGAYYSGTKKQTFTISKAANPMTVKRKTVKLKASEVKKKKQTVKAEKAFTVQGAQGAVSYKKIKGNKKITVSKNGKIKVKKKTKKGKYKIKVQVTAAGNANYDAASKVVTLTVKIK